MDSFRKPRPDVPILPSRAVFRAVSKKRKFVKPKGRRGRKPKGRPKTTQADFITEAEARARVTRETGLRQLQLEQSEKSIKNERDRMRLQGAVAQEEVRYRQLLIDREDRQRQQDFNYRYQEEVRAEQRQANILFAQQQREDRLRADQLGIDERRRREELNFRAQQLEGEAVRQDRLLQDQQQFFGELLQREERRSGENEVRLEGFLRELGAQRAQPQIITFREAQPEEEVGSPLSEVGVPTPSLVARKETPQTDRPQQTPQERGRAIAERVLGGSELKKQLSGASVRLSPAGSPIVEVERGIESRPETATSGERLVRGISAKESLQPEGELTPGQLRGRQIAERAEESFIERLERLRKEQEQVVLSTPEAQEIRDRIYKGILQSAPGLQSQVVGVDLRPQGKGPKPEPEPQPEPEPEPSLVARKEQPQSIASSPTSFRPIDFNKEINPIRKEGRKITVDDLFIEVVSDVNKNLQAGKKFAVRSVPSVSGTGKGNTTKFNIFKEGLSSRGDPQFTVDDAVIQKALQEGKIRFSLKK